MVPKTKKALVFTASTGGGHNAAAKAIKNTLSMDVVVVDVFKELAPELEWLVEDGYYY